MAKKSWAAFAEERKAYPGEEMLVTRDTPDTALNPERLAYLKQRAESVGFVAEIRELRPGHRPQGLWVTWPEASDD